MGLEKKELKLSMKLANIEGHIHLSLGNFSDSYGSFQELRNIALMAFDLETAMYALKQMGHCAIKL